MDNPHRRAHIRPMSQDADLIIVGGGLNGMSLALATAQAGLQVHLIDARPAMHQTEPGFDGRSYAMALTSCRMLKNLGLWPALSPNAQPILEIKVSDGRAGEGPSPFVMHFDHAEIEEGPMGHMIEDRHMRAALQTAVAETDSIIQMSGVEVIAQETGGGRASALLANGARVSAALLVGADGRASAIASKAGIKRTGWSYDQTALVCAIAHEKPHNGVAHQFFMPSGPLAILPLQGNRSSIVWSEHKSQAGAFLALNDADFLTLLRPRFGDFLGDIRLDGQRYSYPLGLSLVHRMTSDRVALIGDAAHGVHPIAGQGLNAGMRDVAALAEVLHAAAKRGEDIGSTAVLDRYKAWRSFDNTALGLATDSFNRLFSNGNPLLQATRRLGMGAIANLPSLRRAFIREAAGLTGDIPPLMQT